MDWGRGAKVCIKGPSDGRGRDERRVTGKGVERGHVVRGHYVALQRVVGWVGASALLVDKM